MNRTTLAMALMFGAVIVFCFVRNCSEYGLVKGVFSVIAALVVVTILVMLVDQLFKLSCRLVKYVSERS